MIAAVLKSLLRTGKFVRNGTDRPFGDHSGAKERVAPAIQPWTLRDLRRLGSSNCGVGCAWFSLVLIFRFVIAVCPCNYADVQRAFEKNSSEAQCGIN
jgi:hypothetical protein